MTAVSFLQTSYFVIRYKHYKYFHNITGQKMQADQQLEKLSTDISN